MNLKQGVSLYWIYMAQDIEEQWALANKIMNLLVT
jgi:hypothetical protein